MPHLWLEHFHDLSAMHAITFIVFQLFFLSFGFSHQGNPAGELLSIDPDMTLCITQMRSAIREPISQGAFHCPDRICQFPNGVVHWKQTGRLYDHGVRQFDIWRPHGRFSNCFPDRHTMGTVSGNGWIIDSFVIVDQLQLLPALKEVIVFTTRNLLVEFYENESIWFVDGEVGICRKMNGDNCGKGN